MLSGTIATAGDDVPVNLDATDLEPFKARSEVLRLTLVVDDFTGLDQLVCFAGIDGLSDNIKWRFNASTATDQIGVAGEPFVVTLKLAEINSTAGDITLSPRGHPMPTDGFTDLRFQVIDDGATAVTVRLLSTELISAASPPLVTVSFDDVDRSMLARAYPSMRERGLLGTAYAIADVIGDDGRATMDGLATLASDGWEIAGHANTLAVHNSRLTDVTAETAMQDLIGLRQWLANNFPDPANEYSFAYPGGEYGLTTDQVPVQDLVANAGFGTARTILSTVGVSTHAQIDSVAPAMPYRLFAMSGISSAASANSPAHPSNLLAEGGMLDKVKANGGWLHLVFHQVVADGAAQTTEINQADFDAIMDGILSRDLTVKTTREAVRPLGKFAEGQEQRHRTVRVSHATPLGRPL